MKPKILIVEDEGIVARSIRLKLEGFGYEVSGVESTGEGAVQSAIEQRPDLVLMDVRLKGGMDGVAAARKIREAMDVPVVYLTAYADEGTIQRAKETAPFGYILKPFEDRELHSAVEMAIYRHSMDRKIKESERRLSTTLSSIGDGVISTDVRGQVGYINPVAESLTGWSASDAQGRDVREVYRVMEQEGQGSGRLLISRTGREMPVEDTASTIKDSKGNVSGSVIVFRDISEKLLLQSEAIRARHMASLGEIAAGVAHEINNPLNGILNLAQMMVNRLGKDTQEQGIAQRIIAESERIANIVGTLLSFSRGDDAGKTTVDIKKALQDSLLLTEGSMKRDGITVLMNMPDILPNITAQSQLIQQVFLNIINNARYALNQMPDGGKEGKHLKITASAVKINGRGFVRVSFFDNGTGIPSSIIGLVMNPFFSTKPHDAGTGLGLSISKGIIENLGGKIGIESAEGDYTNVVVEIPSEQSQQPG